MEYLLYIFESFLASTAIFVFFTVQGAFYVRHLIKDNIWLSLLASLVSIIVFKELFQASQAVIVFILIPGFVLSAFILLTIYRFFRNPKRIITAQPDEFVAAADGQIIYIKEIEKGQVPVSIKKLRLASLDELTKSKLLEEPCYLIGITMTLFDVHVNRAPMAGKVILSQHTPGTYLGLKTPESTITNERNTIVIENENGLRAGVVQIASRFVKRCISTVKENEEVCHGGQIGLIRWGSQADMIIPRNSEIKVRNGDQVYAGLTVIAKYLG